MKSKLFLISALAGSVCLYAADPSGSPVPVPVPLLTPPAGTPAPSLPPSPEPSPSPEPPNSGESNGAQPKENRPEREEAPSRPVEQGMQTEPHIIVDSMEEKIHRIPTFPRVTTTIAFPSKIEAWNGGGFTEEQGKRRGDFFLHHEPGTNVLTIYPVTEPSWRSTPLGENVPRNLNVCCGGKVMVLWVVAASSREESAALVRFEEAAQPSETPTVAPRTPKQSGVQLVGIKPQGDFPGAGVKPQGDLPGAIPSTSPLPEVQRNDVPPELPFQPVSPARVIGVIDTLKALSMTRGETLQSALRAMPGVECSTRGESVDIADYGTYSVRILRVVRSNNIDAIGIEFEIANKSASELAIDPESTTVRAGDAVYPQTTVDIPTKVAPNGKAAGYVVIAGSPNGTPNYLAVTNNFRVSFESNPASMTPAQLEQAMLKETTERQMREELARSTALKKQEEQRKQEEAKRRAREEAATKAKKAHEEAQRAKEEAQKAQEEADARKKAAEDLRKQLAAVEEQTMAAQSAKKKAEQSRRKAEQALEESKLAARKLGVKIEGEGSPGAADSTPTPEPQTANKDPKPTPTPEGSPSPAPKASAQHDAKEQPKSTEG